MMKIYQSTPGHGFTLVEMVVLIMIVGVLAMTVVPKQLQNPMLVEYEARRVLNDIRYVQAMSSQTGQRYRWVRTSATTYQITNASGVAMILPNGSNTLSLSSGVSFGNFNNLPSSLLVFNVSGVPYIDASVPGTALSSTATITLTGNNTTRNITIAPTTGFGAIA